MSDHDAPARTPEQIEAEIAEQREQLADTVDQLAAKLDVKSRAQQKVASLKDSATTETGTPRTEVVAAAVTAGLPVVGVSSRRHLEEVFLGVISAASAPGAPAEPGDEGWSLVERLRQVRAR